MFQKLTHAQFSVPRAMITRGCRQSTTSNSCATFAFPMASMFPAKAPINERTAFHASLMMMRSFTLVADHRCRSPAVRGHHHPMRCSFQPTHTREALRMSSPARNRLFLEAAFLIYPPSLVMPLLCLWDCRAHHRVRGLTPRGQPRIAAC